MLLAKLKYVEIHDFSHQFKKWWLAKPSTKFKSFFHPLLAFLPRALKHRRLLAHSTYMQAYLTIVTYFHKQTFTKKSTHKFSRKVNIFTHNEALTNLVLGITPLSAQIIASKFQNLCQIPLKICGVWKNLGVWLKTHSKFESSLKIWKLTQNFENSLKFLVNTSRGWNWLWRAKLQII